MSRNVPKLNRRALVSGALGTFAAGALGRASAAPLADMTVASAIRGSINAVEFGIWPSTLDDQSRAFMRMLEKAAEGGNPIFLPPGDYVVSNIRLPSGIRLIGSPGATRIVYGGNGYLFAAEDAAYVELSGLSIDGANRALGEQAQALVEMRRVSGLGIDRCVITGSAKSGIALERCSGAVERSTISGASDYAIYSVEATNLRIASNTVSDCGNGGILVHRWQAGTDGTSVTGNRVERVAAALRGTGQYGNGINIFRADNVIVANNHVSDCAFSAIRANSASNVQIIGNNCRRSGEVAIFCEFSFEGATINSNVVDGAATGISIANLDVGGRIATCQGNVVRNVIDKPPYEPYEDADAVFGTGIAVEADTAITGNVIEGAERFGLSIGWGPFLRDVVATGNVIRDSAEGIAVSVVEGAGSALIANNVISGTSKGIVGYRWHEPATGDLAAGARHNFRHLRVDGNLMR